MYNERARFEFQEATAQSARLRFLAGLAELLESAGNISPVSPGFSIKLGPDGRAVIDVWQPGKSTVLFRELHAAAERGLLRMA